MADAPRTLRTHLFAWFLGAIVLAFVASALVVNYTRPENTTGGEVVARTVATHLAELWGDHRAADGYVEEVHEVTGFDVKLHRSLDGLPGAVRAVGLRGGVLVNAGPERVFVPIVRGGHVVGALEMERFGYRPPLYQWWRVVAAAVVALVVLSFAAGTVSNQLARPLERLGTAADRFGGGDLAVRTALGSGKRWMAKEVRDVAVAFDTMAGRVESMVRGQRELLGAISHEIRSPLGRARIALEIARDRVVEETPSQSARRSPAPQLDEIERQLGEVDKILGDLLAVTRAGLADLRKETLVFVPWLRARAAEEPSPPALEVTGEVAEDARVAADGALLGRALHNLVANARAHGHPSELPITVHVGDEGAFLVVTVRDRGPGFPAELLPRAFDPFVRGDTSRTRTLEGGTGLGLALVRRIAEAHGGEAFARNADGGGAEVGIRLPRAAASD